MKRKNSYTIQCGAHKSRTTNHPHNSLSRTDWLSVWMSLFTNCWWTNFLRRKKQHLSFLFTLVLMENRSGSNSSSVWQIAYNQRQFTIQIKQKGSPFLVYRLDGHYTIYHPIHHNHKPPGIFPFFSSDVLYARVDSISTSISFERETVDDRPDQTMSTLNNRFPTVFPLKNNCERGRFIWICRVTTPNFEEKVWKERKTTNGPWIYKWCTYKQFNWIAKTTPFTTMVK